MSKPKLILIILAILTLCISSGIFVYLASKNFTKTDNSSEEETFKTIKNIVFDREQNKVFVINESDKRVRILKDINFSRDDIFLNLNNGFLVLQHYDSNISESKPKSLVYKVTTDKIELIHQAENEKIIYFEDKDNYIYTTSSASVFKRGGKDEVLGSTIYALGYKSNRKSYNSYFVQKLNGGVVEEIYENGKYMSAYIYSCVYCPSDSISPYFLLTEKYQIFSSFNTATEKNFINIYNREDPNLTKEKYENRDKEVSTSVKEISIDKAPSLMSLRGDKVYLTLNKENKNYEVYLLDLNTLDIKVVEEFHSNEELIY